MKDLIAVVVDGVHPPRIAVNIVERSIEIVGGPAAMSNAPKKYKPLDPDVASKDVDDEEEVYEPEQYDELEKFVTDLKHEKDPAKVAERERMRLSLKQALEQDVVTAGRKVRAAVSDLNGAPAHLKDVYRERLRKAEAYLETARNELAEAERKFEF